MHNHSVLTTAGKFSVFGSMVAGKLHALLTHKYVKGRDVYDLMWYLSDRTWPEPNVVLLNNALKQTGWSGPKMTATN